VTNKDELTCKIIFGDSRHMAEIEDSTVHLVVTSPPYWQLKDYGVPGQVGFDDTYEEYIVNLNKVWKESYRVLAPGCRLCVNIGDQFARSVIYGRYKVIPIREEIIKFCESIGFDYMGAIIWQKKTTINTTGGATVMGSFPYPRNGIVEIDYEFILIFKKLGRGPHVSKEVREKSKLTKEEWKEYFNGHWYFGGEKQDKHIAMFPEELPRRLIKMFTFVGETVLDPFIGSGTTALAACKLGRSAIGYEINRDFLPTIKRKLSVLENLQGTLFDSSKVNVDIVYQNAPQLIQSERIEITTAHSLSNGIKRKVDPRLLKFGSVVSVGDQAKDRFYTVREIIDVNKLALDTGLLVKLIGVNPVDDREVRQQAIDYLNQYVRGKQVFLKFEGQNLEASENEVPAYVYLKNRIFINGSLIRQGFARADSQIHHRLFNKFLSYQQEAKEKKIGVWLLQKEKVSHSG
jgi:site-specific DNA-methyltransferase (adenine-specific)